MHALEKRCFTLPWTLAQCQGALAQRAFAAFGLWRGDELAAYISIYHAAGEMEILNIAVLPQWRRKGLGRQILSTALQAARKMGMQKASLEVRAGNRAAIGLYESMGFLKAGTRKRYYPDTGEDAWIYIYEFAAAGNGGKSA